MAARTFIVYLAAIILVRLGEKRFLGKYAALDVILGFALGSILNSAVTGSSAFFEMLGASLVLVLLHGCLPFRLFIQTASAIWSREIKARAG